MTTKETDTTSSTSKHNATNPYGYRGFANRHSLMLATGVALIILGGALASFASLLPSIDRADSAVISKAIDEIVRLASKDILETNFASSHALSTIVFITFIIIGSWLLGRAKDDLHEFQSAYPHLEITFSSAELHRLTKRGTGLIIAGALLIGATIGIGIALHGFTNIYTDLESTHQILRTQAITTGVLLIFMAMGWWLLIRGITVRHIPNMAHYNYKALSERNIYEMDRDSTGALNQKLLRARVMVAHKDMRNRTFIILGIIAALALYALPSLETPYFWIALVGAFIACKVSSGFAYRQVCALFSEPPHDYKGRDQDK